MKTIAHFVSMPSRCSYLPDRLASIEYDRVASLTAGEYQQLVEMGWRRFGHTVFRPVCRTCNECRSLRVLVDRFQPNRSQRRVRKLNDGTLRLEVGIPAVSREKLDLYDRYHAYQSDLKDWPAHPPKDLAEFIGAYVDNPFRGQEYCYYLQDRLIAVGYVDALPGAFSAVYCFYDPDERSRSLGTFNVLSIIENARRLSVPHVYLGYFVEECGSLAYKANFVPNQIRGSDGIWRDFRGLSG
jgi:leucyl-tRNA---protein transferase